MCVGTVLIDQTSSKFKADAALLESAAVQDICMQTFFKVIQFISPKIFLNFLEIHLIGTDVFSKLYH
jgi:hypothetical protein